MDETVFHATAAEVGHETASQTGTGTRSDDDVGIGIVDVAVDDPSATKVTDDATYLIALQGTCLPAVVHRTATDTVNDTADGGRGGDSAAVVAVFHFAGGAGVVINDATPIGSAAGDGGCEVAIHYGTLVVVADTPNLRSREGQGASDIAFADGAVVVETDACQMAAGSRQVGFAFTAHDEGTSHILSRDASDVGIGGGNHARDRGVVDSAVDYLTTINVAEGGDAF